mmetsp:Transcript_10448/g.32441  ORF Transcript_10448/g.32441 Transcript_10448/m.32441 type:complete len:116 (+) Transcript_10448:97-444(+)
MAQTRAIRAALALLLAVAASAASSLRSSERSSGRASRPHYDNMWDHYEHGDRENMVSTGSMSEYSLHNLLAHDDGRDGSSTAGADGAQLDLDRRKALEQADAFDTEDTPGEMDED